MTGRNNYRVLSSSFPSGCGWEGFMTCFPSCDKTIICPWKWPYFLIIPIFSYDPPHSEALDKAHFTFHCSFCLDHAPILILLSWILLTNSLACWLYNWTDSSPYTLQHYTLGQHVPLTHQYLPARLHGVIITKTPISNVLYYLLSIIHCC